jgi:hypothetical protein
MRGVPMFKHEDERRTLIEYASGTFRVAKVLTAKRNCIVGDHYHAHKDETFLLLSGHANKIVIGDTVIEGVDAPYQFFVPRMHYHLFDLEAGSVLLGVGTEAFDPSDEITGRP